MVNEHLHIQQNKIDNNFYLESPILNYKFLSRPQINYSHSQKIPINVSQQSENFINAIKKCMHNLYPICFTDRISEELINIKRWTNLFILNGCFLHKDEDNSKIAYFLIQNNDMIENYLQAFCELYKFVNVSKTIEKLALFNQELSDYMNLNYVVDELTQAGVIQEDNIIERFDNEN